VWKLSPWSFGHSEGKQSPLLVIVRTIAIHLVAGNPPIKLIDTTLVRKLSRGTVVIPLPNGKKSISLGQSADE